MEILIANQPVQYSTYGNFGINRIDFVRLIAGDILKTAVRGKQ